MKTLVDKLKELETLLHKNSIKEFHCKEFLKVHKHFNNAVDELKRNLKDFGLREERLEILDLETSKLNEDLARFIIIIFDEIIDKIIVLHN